MKYLRKLLPMIFLSAVMFYSGCEKVSNPQYHVDSAACNECGNCIQVCPVDAIEFGPNGKAVIDQTKCKQCGKCISVCPQDAIY